MAKSTPNRSRVFISYSHQDKKKLDEFQVHLGFLERNGKIDYWDDTKIIPGSQWREEIRQAINSAKVAILFISPDFLNSEFIANDELPPLLTAANQEDVTILPVIIRHSLFKYTDLAHFQAVNDPSQPLSDMKKSRREKEWVKIVEIVINALPSQKQIERLTNHPISADDLIIYGKYLNGRQEYFEAANVLRQACQLKQGSFDAWFEYAYSLTKLERHNEAAKALEHAKALDPRPNTKTKEHKLSDSEKVSVFSGVGSGTYNHGLGTVPDEIVLLNANGSQGMRYDNVSSTTVHIINSPPITFTALAIKHRKPH